jgi:uncharacterized repeat protein (TIGR03803 family)
MSKVNFSWWKTACAALLLLAAMAVALPAQTFTTLVNFDGTDGSLPLPAGCLTQGADGDLYGTAKFGGANDAGTIFKLSPAGTLTTLYSFCAQTNCADGANPNVGLVLGTDGNFYGTTYAGGALGYGAVFKVTPSGTLTTIHSFAAGADGNNPSAALVQAGDGKFYGTAYGGGAYGYGTVFKITPEGVLTTLHSFDSADGSRPGAALIQATDGNLYGTSQLGGTSGYGTVFKITRGGALTTLHSFDSTDGACPSGALVQAGNGSLYSTTALGGSSGACSGGCGTIFEIDLAEQLTVLHNFALSDGEYPQGGVFQATSGTFYGTTVMGGANMGCTFGSCGTVFSLAVGLGPFVETVPTSGTVGAAVTILGTNLTGTTKVSFNGTPATFTVVSSFEITTTVPRGATTGKVKVTTPSGTLSSNVNFRVTPGILSFLPTSGPVGTVVTITGNSFTGATSVTFGGVKATSFTVNSYTQITATVPVGAKTGKIGVTTPGGTATSTAIFTVT